MLIMICGNTGIIVGSEMCEYCRVHSCQGYKIVMKNKKKRHNSIINTLIKMIKKEINKYGIR